MKAKILTNIFFVKIAILIACLSACEKTANDEPEIKTDSQVLEMVKVPGAKSFPIGIYDKENCATVNYPYFMSKYEVTYEQWTKIYQWATSAERGANKYSFSKISRCGAFYDKKFTSFPATSENMTQPVSYVPWAEALIWCNALTEYSNAMNGTNWECVYKDKDQILRWTDNSLMYKIMPCNIKAKGYRLPSGPEWELAARYVDGTSWTNGNFASGASSYIFHEGLRYNAYGNPYSANVVNTNLDATREVAWFCDDPQGASLPGSTHPVGQKKPNALGIYDMSGNVWEWTTDVWNNWAAIPRGGCWDPKDMSELDSYSHLAYLAVGWASHDSEFYEQSMGFRPVRTE